MPSKEYSDPPMSLTGSAAWLNEALGNGGGGCGGRKVLVLDCRTQAAFQHSHIRGAINITLPSLMLRRLANGRLSLANAVKGAEGGEAFGRDCRTSTVVLYDDAAVDGDPNSADADGHPPGAVAAALMRRLRQDGCVAVMLEGGFQSFQSQYPEWCRGSSSSTTPSNNVGGGNEPTVLGLRNLRIAGCSDSSDSASSEEEASAEWASSSSSSSSSSSAGGLGVGLSPAGDSPFPVEILPNLFLGNARNSADQASLRRHRIRYILNVTPNLPNRFAQEPGIKYMQIPISDHWSQDLASFFPDAIAFIDEAMGQRVGVLVHCLAGISRSVTITVAYLMHALGMSLNDAYDFVKSRKANISPNFNFMGQLVDFERQLSRADHSANLLLSPPPAPFGLLRPPRPSRLLYHQPPNSTTPFGPPVEEELPLTPHSPREPSEAWNT